MYTITLKCFQLHEIFRSCFPISENPLPYIQTLGSSILSPTLLDFETRYGMDGLGPGPYQTMMGFTTSPCPMTFTAFSKSLKSKNLTSFSTGNMPSFHH